MRPSALLAGFVAVVLLAGCPKNEPPQAEPQKSEPPKVEPRKEEARAEVKAEEKSQTKEEPRAEEKTEQVAAEVKKEEPKADKAEPSSEENCGALYDVAKQLVEAFGKKPGGKVSKELPPRDKYIEACKQLPVEVTRCMNPQIASREAQKCKEVMQKAMTTDRTKLQKAMRGMSGKQ